MFCALINHKQKSQKQQIYRLFYRDGDSINYNTKNKL